MLLPVATAAEPAPGNYPPCTHGRSAPVTDLSNGEARYCIVLCRVAVVTERERAPACQRKGSAESWRVTESLTFLSVWLTAPPFIDMKIHSHTHTGTMKWGCRLSCFCWVALSMSSNLLFSVNLKILPFFSSLTSDTSGDHIQILSAAIQGCSRSCISQCHGPNLLAHTSKYLSYTFITLLPAVSSLSTQLSLEYPMMDWPLCSNCTTVSLCFLWPQLKTCISRSWSRIILVCFSSNSTITDVAPDIHI